MVVGKKIITFFIKNLSLYNDHIIIISEVQVFDIDRPERFWCVLRMQLFLGRR